jgi:hypothetical protein
MNDFLARLATRAIGGESLLRPRLPALFEPPAAASPEPLAEADPGNVGGHATATAAQVLSLAEARQPAPAAPATAGTAGTSLASPLPAAAPSPQPPRLQASAEPPAVAARTKARAQQSSAGRPPDHRPPQAAGMPLELPRRRVIQVAPERPSVPPRSSRGTLRPPASPVFAASRDESPARAPAPHAAAAHPRMPATEESRRVATEPVVHVSIGRLEVRTVPATPAPSRQRDAPRPSSLDDYLRHRDKASP